jgi:hypothetical protein
MNKFCSIVILTAALAATASPALGLQCLDGQSRLYRFVQASGRVMANAQAPHTHGVGQWVVANGTSAVMQATGQGLKNIPKCPWAADQLRNGPQP